MPYPTTSPDAEDLDRRALISDPEFLRTVQDYFLSLEQLAYGWAGEAPGEYWVQGLLHKTPILFDGRNIFDPRRVRDVGFTYYGIGVR